MPLCTFLRKMSSTRPSSATKPSETTGVSSTTPCAKHVIPVSPNSFYAYLAAIAYGLKGLHIEKRAKEIWGQLGQLRTGIDRFSEEFLVLGRHLDNARGKYGDADGRLVKLREALEKISGAEDSTGDETP